MLVYIKNITTVDSMSSGSNRISQTFLDKNRFSLFVLGNCFNVSSPDIFSVVEISLIFLFSFFVCRQWLPRQKLELLGRNQKVDSTKLYEGKKPSLRKSVQQAFARALSYKEQISTRDDEVGNDFMDKDEDVEEDMREEEEAGGDDDSS